jgi:ABC-type lipoprotein export system ATPase subunit
MSEETILLDVRRVTKRYEPQAPVVLNGLDLQVRAGESVAIVGPSGSGKSTLLNLISALDHPDDGEVHLDGQLLRDLSEKELARLRNEKIGFVFQMHHLLPQCTVWENILLPTLPGGSKGDVRQRAADLLGRVGLVEKRDAFPGELSGGQRQRVAVVRALINAPKLLLADEPTGSLDQHTAEEMASLLVELNQEQAGGTEGMALVVVTHSLELASHMQRVLELHDGTLQPREKATT